MASKFGNITRDQILASLGDEEQDPIVPASPLLSELPKKKPKFNYDAIGKALNEQPVQEPVIPPPTAKANVSIRSAIAGQQNESPKDFAKLLELSKLTGYPVDVVRANRTKIETKQSIDNVNIDTLQHTNPGLVKFLAEPNNAKLVGSDISTLAMLEAAMAEDQKAFLNREWTMNQPRNTAAENIFKKVAQRTNQVVGNFASSVIQIRQALTPKGMQKLDPLGSMYVMKGMTDIDYGHQEFLEATPDQMEKRFKEEGLSVELAGDFGYFLAETGAASIVDMLAMTTGVGTGGYILSRSYEMAGERAKNSGRSTPQIKDTMISMPFVMTSVLFDKIGIKGIRDAIFDNTKLMEVVGVSYLKYAIKKYGAAALKEGGTEFVQEGIIEYLGEKVGTDASMTVGEAIKRGAWGAVAGFATGGAISTAVGVPVDVMKMREFGMMNDSEKEQTTINNVIAGVQESQLKEISPEKLNEFLQTVAPGANIHMDAESVLAYAKENGIDVTTDPAFASIADKLEEAAATGGTVEMPIGDFAQNVVGSEHEQALRGDIKMSDNTFTLNEMDRQKEALAATYEMMEEQAVARQEESDYIDAEIDKFITQGSDTGRLTRQEVTLQSQLYKQQIISAAERTGIPVKEYIETYGLNAIVGPHSGLQNKLKDLNQATLESLIAEFDSLGFSSELTEAEKALVLEAEPQQRVQRLLEVTGLGEDAAWTPERIDQTVREWAYPHGETRAQVIFINPAEFVNSTHPDPQTIADESMPLDPVELKAERQTPFLRTDGQGKIIGHEGRHRMAALAAAGVSRVPVVVTYPTSQDPSDITFDNYQFKGQEFGTGTSADLFVSGANAMPITKENQEEIQAAMNPDAAVVFQARQQGYAGTDTGEAVEWTRAVEKGLDMSPEGRMTRAVEMGFNVENVLNIGGTVGDVFVSSNLLQSWNEYYYRQDENFNELESFLNAVNHISEYGGKVYRYITLNDISELDLKNIGDHWTIEKYLAEDIAERFTYTYNQGSKQKFLIEATIPAKSVSINSVDLTGNPEEQEVNPTRITSLKVSHLGSNDVVYESQGGDYLPTTPSEGSREEIGVSHKNIRSVNAAFDPDYKDSANLLAQKVSSAKPIPTTIDEITTLENAMDRAKNGDYSTNRQLKVDIQNDTNNAAKEAGVDLAVDNAATEEYLVRVGIRDALHALKTNENAVGWYDVTVQKALNILATIHPELAEDQEARFAFTWALAVTSNGIKVDKNFELAEIAYEHYKRTGKMPTNIKAGNAQKAINDSLKSFNTLVERMGIETLRKFMVSNFTIAQIRRIGLDVTGENAGTVVRGASILGPKIGNGFFSNLNGYFDQLTMDRWLMRTWGRWTGTLIEYRPDMVKLKKSEIKDLVKLLKEDKAAAKEFAETLGAKLQVGNLEKLALDIQKASMLPANRDKFNKTAVGENLRKAGNSLAKYLDGQKEAPETGTERNWIRKIFGNILKDLQNNGYPELTMSDLQALMWYPERRLYDMAKSSKDVSAGYTDDEAPDYANAAADLAIAKGIPSESIKEATNKAEVDYAARISTRAARQDDGGAGSSEVGSTVSEGFNGRERAKFLKRNVFVSARLSRTNDAKSRSYGKGSPGTLGSIRGLVYKVNRTFKNILSASEVPAVDMVEMESTAESAVDFMSAIQSSKDSTVFGAAVYVYSAEEYQDMRLFRSEDGLSGFAIKKDGDIVSVFSDGGGKVVSMLSLAVEQGGTKLDAFDTALVGMYGINGFKEVGRDEWNENYKPSDWDKAVFGKYNNGEPDIVYMAYDGSYSPYDANQLLQDQESGTTTRGSYNREKRIISLFEQSDRSTLIHEMGHYFLDTMINSNDPLMQPIFRWWLDNAESIAAEAGVSVEQVTQYVYTREGSPEVERAMHEHWARAYEAYIMEGKAPVSALKKAFKAFSQWMKSVYGTLKNLEAQSGAVKIDDNIRKVFDAMLSVDEQVAAEKSDAELRPLFTDAVMAGMTEEQFKKYKEKQDSADEKATETLLEKVMKQIRTREEKEWAEELKTRAEVIKSRLDQQPIHMARAALAEKGSELKLNRQDVLDVLDVKVLPPELKGINNALTVADGVDIDAAADALGFASGDELITQLIETKRSSMLAKEQAEAEMVKEHGDILNDGTIEKLAREAVHDEQRGELILSELKILNKGKPTPQSDKQILKALAEEAIGKLSLSEIRPDKYRRAEIKAAQDARAAMDKGDKEAAKAAKTRQAMNFYLYRSALDAKAMEDKIVTHMAKFKKKKVLERVGRAGKQYLEQILHLQERFEFRKSVSMAQTERDNIGVWALEREKENGDNIQLTPTALNEDIRTHYKKLPFSDLVGIYDSVRNIEHIAIFTDKMKLAGEQLSFEEAKAKALESISKVKSKFTYGVSAYKETNKNLALKSLASLTKIPYLIRWLDNRETSGVMHQLVSQQFTDAQHEEMLLHDAVGSPIVKAIAARDRKSKKRHARKFRIVGLENTKSNQKTLTGSEIISVALNTGNPGNLKKLLMGEGWALSEEEVSQDNPMLKQVLSHLTKEDWDFVQLVWDQLELLYEPMNAVHKRTSGLDIGKVEIHEVQTPFGVYKGGYFPLKADPMRSTIADTREIDQKTAAAAGMSATSGTFRPNATTGAKIERIEATYPIKLGLDVIPGHIQEVIHYITHYEAVKSVDKLLRDPEITEAIKATMGVAEYRLFKPWLNDIANAGSNQESQGYFTGPMRRIRFGITMSAMGFKVSTGLMQILGLSVTIANIGAKNTSKAMLHLYGNPAKTSDAVAVAMEKSKVLVHRMKTMDREMSNAFKALENKSGPLADLQEFSMKHIALIQMYSVDLPTWYGAYFKKMSELEASLDPNDFDTVEALTARAEELSVQAADWAVENFQGSGSIKDQAALMRDNSEYVKMYTMFMTFFSSQGNMTRDITRGSRSGQINPINLAVKFAWLFGVTTAAEMLVREGIPDDEDEWDEFWQQYLVNVAMLPLAAIPLARDVASGAFSGYGYAGSPTAQFVSNSISGVKGFTKSLWEGDEPTLFQVKATTDVVTTMLGVPGTGQGWTTGKAIYDIREDGYDFSVHSLLLGTKKE